jgi:high-affinity K+ transport system ATPase subunit B
MTRDAVTAFFIANDVAKSFALAPAMLERAQPPLTMPHPLR